MKSTLMSLSIVFALAGAGVAFAQDQGGSMQGPNGGHHGEFKAACGADMQTYCASAQSREDRHACMQQNMAKLSQGCQTFLSSHMHGQSGGSNGGGQ